MSTTLTISAVSTPAELEQVHGLRRAVFEAELGQGYAMLHDPLDDHSSILLVTHEGSPIATARFTVRADGPLEDEAELLLPWWKSLAGFADDEIAQCSRTAIRPAFRGRGLLQFMARHLHAEALRRGVKLVFIDSCSELVDYYLRIGFRRFRLPYHHPTLDREYTPLFMLVGDRGSPTAALAGTSPAHGARPSIPQYEDGTLDAHTIIITLMMVAKRLPLLLVILSLVACGDDNAADECAMDESSTTGDTCDIDADEALEWFNYGSAVGAFAQIHHPVAYLVVEDGFVFDDPMCPEVTDNGTIVTIMGGCENVNGDEWQGAAAFVRGPGSRDLQMAFSEFDGITGTAQTKQLSGDNYIYEVHLSRSDDGTTVEFDYEGQIDGWYNELTVWNGSGTLKITNPHGPPSGLAHVTTVDEHYILNLDEDLIPPFSGQTTVVIDDCELVVTYDEQTRETQISQWSINGVLQEQPVDGITCSVGSTSPSDVTITGLGVFALLCLWRRRERSALTDPPR